MRSGDLVQVVQEFSRFQELEEQLGGHRVRKPTIGDSRGHRVLGAQGVAKEL